ncbi:MAG: aminotransferase class I/II-fold pyridoxal phosphate-dependent enzyme, partial [Anaerolineales bacterium]|nr:aminotransferase class I/II-fold pyridoxal phosphate-dependent enzyme [Anaerolineales bacterium]
MTQSTEPIRLNSNENPMGPSPLALQSVTHVLSQVNTYPGPEMPVQLQEAIAAAWGHRITPDHIVLGSGSVGVMNLVARLYLDTPEAECLVMPPVFPYFLNYCRENGRKLVTVPLQGESFRADLTAVLA